MLLTPGAETDAVVIVEEASGFEAEEEDVWAACDEADAWEGDSDAWEAVLPLMTAGIYLLFKSKYNYSFLAISL